MAAPYSDNVPETGNGGYTPPPAAPPPPPSSGGGGNGNGGGYTPGTWDGVLSWAVPGAPMFNAPRFAAPDMNAMMRDPGFAARLAGGRDALEKSAAARGVLRTGGTLRDLVNYNQNFAAQEYSNVFQRALAEYGANYNAAKDSYAPRMAQWKEEALAARLSAMDTYDKSYNAWALGQHNAAQAAYADSQPPA